jgi:hypothetical protein
VFSCISVHSDKRITKQKPAQRTAPAKDLLL